MKLSVSAYRAHASAHKKILSSGYHSQLNYGSTGAAVSSSAILQMVRQYIFRILIFFLYLMNELLNEPF